MQLIRTSASRGSRISVVMGSALVLIMVGIICLFFLVAKQFTQHVQSQFTVQIMLKADLDNTAILAIQKKLESNEVISSVRFTSAEDGAKAYAEEIGEDFVQIIGSNPIPPTLDAQVKPEFAEPQKLEAFVNEIQKDAQVKEVVYQKNLLQEVNENIRKWSLILGAIALIFLVIAVFLIMNTVELAVSSQRYIIRSMQLVGATPRFIKKPFLFDGIKNGLLSALIAWTSISGILFFYREELTDIVTLLIEGNGFWILGGVLTLLGVCMNLFSSNWTVSRYIRAKQDQLV